MIVLALVALLAAPSPPIDEPAQATRPAVRVGVVEWPDQYDTVAAEVGLFGLPFAQPGLDACDEMNFYREQFDLPDRFSDQPRSGPRRQQGIGWRESNCSNDVRTSCCFGYYQIGIGNRTAPGYQAAGIFEWCAVARSADFYGDAPLAKQKQACVAAGLYQYHVTNGPYGTYPWDAFL